MRYVTTRYIESQRELAYRIYVTDSLQLIGKATGGYLEKRFADLISTSTAPKKTAEEIIDDLQRNGLEIQD